MLLVKHRVRTFKLEFTQYFLIGQYFHKILSQINFYFNKPEEELEQKENTIVIMGHYNAQLGKEQYLQNVAGRYTVR